MMTNTQKTTIINALKSHIGSNNTISAGEIAAMIGESSEDTHVVTRSYITEVIKSEHLPVAANTKGYFYIATKEQRDKYIDNLDKRIAGIEDRKKTIIDNFDDTY